MASVRRGQGEGEGKGKFKGKGEGEGKGQGEGEVWVRARARALGSKATVIISTLLYKPLICCCKNMGNGYSMGELNGCRLL
jgi:hypothetical protein